MVLKEILGPPGDPAVRTERLKLVASGLQLVAIAVMGAAIIAPAFNPLLTPSLWTRVEGGATAAAIELIALRVLGYLRTTPSKGG